MAGKTNPGIEKRLENIEELLKMMLVNNVLWEDNVENISEQVILAAKDVLLPLGLRNIRLNYIENQNYIFAEIDLDNKLSAIKKIYTEACNRMAGVKVVLAFDKLHAKRKASFDEAKISYYIKGGEAKFF